MKQGRIISLSEGFSRDTRNIPTLDPGYFMVDELSFEKLIGMIVKLAGKINFFQDGEDDVQGTWQPFFLRDETVILALMINFNLEKFADGFFTKLNDSKAVYPLPQRLKLFREAVLYLIGNAEEVNEWYEQLSRSRRNTHIFDELGNAIGKKLDRHLQHLIRIVITIERFQKNSTHYENRFADRFHPIWNAGAFFDLAPLGPDLRAAVNAETDMVRDIYYDFSDSIYQLRKLASDFLKESLSGGNHPPQIALLLAFLKLYENNRHRLNEVTRRHLDHYYMDVLRVTPQKPVADKVNVAFTAAAHVQNYLVAAGTALDGGKDADGNDVVFTTVEDLIVTRASVAQLKTVFAGRHHDIYTGTRRQLVTRIHVAEVLDDVNKPDEFVSWPTFGEFEIFRRSDYNRQRDADIGFAVSSPILQLQQGDREIVMEFEFTHSSFSALTSLIEDVASRENTSVAGAFYKVFFRSFHIHLTTDTGWGRVEEYMVTSAYAEGNNDAHSLVFRLSVPNSFRPVVNFNEALHGADPRDRFDAKWPVAKIIIASDSTFYPYSFINGLVVEKIHLSVEARGLRNVTLVNQHGPLNASQPFTPFGSFPVKGSYLLIGQREVFSKALDNLNIRIQWLGLPETKYGFTEYYAGYPEEVVNESFQCRLSILNNYRWAPATRSEQQNIMLFESRDPFSRIPDYSLKPGTDINYIDMGKIRLPWSYEDTSAELAYSNDLQRGFIRLELVAPGMAFGNDLYPGLLSEAVMRKAKNKTYIEPNKPYVPVINDIRIDYKSSLTVNFASYSKEDREQGVFFHIQPFGHQELSPAIVSERITLLPHFDEEGTLYVGIANLDAPQTLSLFFHLHENPSGNTDYRKPVVRWSYLCDNEWKQLPMSRVLKDTTESFIKSGIVTLEIPADITQRNTVLPGGVSWIRAEVTTGTAHASNTIRVYTHAVQALRDVTGPVFETLPADSIQALTVKVPEILSVIQPCPSFSGHSGERNRDLYLRVSERLKHKKRALMASDYELLVLEKFHSIFKVKAITMAPNSLRAGGGGVRVIVLPDVYRTNAVNVREPRVNTWLLNEITGYLKKHAPAFASIEVINPEFEHVRVSCRVNFKKGCNNGFYIQKLNDELTQYLTPWLGNNRTFEFGQPMNKHNILAFMEGLPYVEVVNGLGINLVTHSDQRYQLTSFTGAEGEDGIIYPSNPWSILVSAGSHFIRIVDEFGEASPVETGIEYLSVGMDFIINT